MSALPAGFFNRSALEVAPDLLGCLLLREGRGSPRLGRIVEVEAYLGDGTDPAAHSHRGPTQRNRSMFGPAGHFYVYRSMGIHHCLNVVCQPKGEASAVLIRALEPLEGLTAMRRLRGVRSDRELTSGPGKLCQALGVNLRFDGVAIDRGPLRLLPAEHRAKRVLISARIGISRAADLPYRFFEAANPNVSRSPLNRSAQALP